MSIKSDKLSPEDRREMEHRLEEMGVEGVKIALQTMTNISDVERWFAWEWLKEKTEGERTQANWILIASITAAITGVVGVIVSGIQLYISLCGP